jgi:hypothetical protein
MQDPHEIINQLSPKDGLAILQTLAREDEQLAIRIAEIARARLRDVDPEKVAFHLYEELEFLEVEEVWDRSGSTRHGYVDPGEAADEMMGEVVDPHLDELKKLHALAMNAQANQMCKGLLLGLYKFDHESTSKFKDWAPDSADGFAGAVIRAWKRGAPDKAGIAEVRAFIEEELGGWWSRIV